MDRSLYVTRWAYLMFLHVLVALFGAHSALTAGRDAASLGFSMALAFGVVLCCTIDARLRGQPILHILQFVMLWTWPVALPVYLLWSRRWRGLLWCASILFSYFAMSLLGWFAVMAIINHAR